MKSLYFFFSFLLILLVNIAAQQKQTLYVNGRDLYTPCGEKVILRGINKMIIWTGDLKVRHDAYAEIRKTGANCVRIVWLANPTVNEQDSGPDGLDRTIQDCIDNHMIPMVELHDATGYWAGLQQLVDFWTSPDVLAVVKKHEKYFLLNIGNEVGDETVTDDQFKAGYESAINQIRNAGIKCPLVIDASDWGKNLAQLRNTGSYLINKDPEHNLLFSVHMYWAISDGADAQYIKNELQTSVNQNLPFIVGEFTYKFQREAGCDYETDYQTIIQVCQQNEIGWLVWEWGPGNEFFQPSCDIMNMTSDSYYNTLKDTWAKVVALTSPYSINTTSVTPKYILSGGDCPVNVENNLTQAQFSFDIYPNPVSSHANVSVNLDESGSFSIIIYDILGREVNRIADGYYTKGNHNFIFRTNHELSAGIYFCRFQSPNISRVVRVVKLPR